MDSIKYTDRKRTTVFEEDVPSGAMLKWFYNVGLGKLALHLLVKRKLFSMLGGWYMNSRFSKGRIQQFIDTYKIDMSVYDIPANGEFRTFNEFFYRTVKPECRPLEDDIVSPADGRILAFQSLKDVSSFFVKGSEFMLESFLQDEKLTHKYADGSMFIIRLAPTDYHRFHFPSSGKISSSKAIKGHYFSVSPLALNKSLEIFCQNQREYSILQTKEYGDILISEVGATMVGSIIQSYQANSEIEKGQEKGYFAFGGSTVVLLFEKGSIKIDEDIVSNTKDGMETLIKMGERIGG